MPRSIAHVAGLWLLVLAGCTPTVSGGVFECAADGRACPEGYRCSDEGFCCLLDDTTTEGCGQSDDAGALDGGPADGGLDAGPFDAGPFDAGPGDSGLDAGPVPDAALDAGRDAAPDASLDAELDAGPLESVTHSTLADFADWDGGADLHRDVNLSLTASGVEVANASDLDCDGFSDIIVSGAGSTLPYAVIFPGTSDGFGPAHPIGRRASGGSAIADYNQDGSLDLVFVGGTGSPAEVALGAGGCSAGALPSAYASIGSLGNYHESGHTVVVHELNGAAPPELISTENGSDNTLRVGEATWLDNRVAVEVAFIDDDPFPDLVTSNGSNTRIYWGAADGFDGDSEFEQVATAGGRRNCIADLDGDSHLDIVVASERPEGAHIVWGSGTRTITATPTRIAGSAGSQECSIGDVDGDGNLDIVFAEDANSSIHFGPGLGARSFSESYILPDSDDGIGVVLANFGGPSGSMDIFLSVSTGASRLYRMTASRIWTEVTPTSDFETAAASFGVTRDFGTSLDRSDVHQYTSAVVDLGDGEQLRGIDWVANERGGNVGLQVCASATPDPCEDFRGPTSASDPFEAPAVLATPIAGRYARYRVFFDTHGHVRRPGIESVSLQH
ncbi:MAG: FG-GAP repeat domain-containing protein [Sandaracinaceae bacterium]